MGDEQTDEHLVDSQTVVAAVEAMLLEHPNALVVAVNPGGLTVPMPISVPLRNHKILEGRSFVDHVVREDTAGVARCWYQMLLTGESEISLRFASEPGCWFKFHMADTREAYGVLLGIAFAENSEGGHGVGEADVEIEIEIGRTRYCTYRLNDGAGVVDCDEAYTRMFGWTAEELAGRSSLDLVHPDDQTRAIDGWMAMLATRRPQQIRGRRLCKDGTWVWVDATLHSFLGHPGRDYVLIELIDVSVEMAAQEALAAREQLLDRLAQALPVGLFQIEVDRRIVYSNERLYEILGTSATEDLVRLTESVTPEHRSLLDEVLTAVLNKDQVASDVELDLCLPETGERRRCLVSLRALNSPDGAVTGAIVCVSDITASARMHLELADKATFDVLTRCFNRGATMAALDGALAGLGCGRTGVIFVDLDNFKPVNDRLGHAAGDELLATIATQLTEAMRGKDIVGRIGGDEFLVVCHNIDGPEEILIIAQRIAEVLTQEIVLTAGTVDLSASIGVAWSEPGMSADALVAHADEAMYHSKHQAQGLPVLYTDTLPALAANPPDKKARRAGYQERRPGRTSGRDSERGADASSSQHLKEDALLEDNRILRNELRRLQAQLALPPPSVSTPRTHEGQKGQESNPAGRCR